MSWVTEDNQELFVDLYGLTMAAAYHALDMDQTATFDLFVREMPPHRSFLVFCGLEQVLDYLEKLHFGPRSIAYLRSLGLFREDFLDALSQLRFTGDVWAMSEGELFFPPEPVLRVTAPLMQAQILETMLINTVTFQSMIASKAARLSLACSTKPFVDFSPRRDHGADAALKAARAAYVGGASSTSNVLAGREFGLDLTGTMAHSYVMAFPTEEQAFIEFARLFPDKAVFLIDTYDVDEGARAAAKAAARLHEEGISARGVRIDSGDLAAHSVAVRKILDEAGQSQMQIIVSGDLDEYRIEDILRSGAPVDGFGVGTQLGTSADAPFLGGVYKLVADRGEPRMKLSAGKVTLPGNKQVFRRMDAGILTEDVIGLDDEIIDEHEALLVKVMSGGRRVVAEASLEQVRTRCLDRLSHLPEPMRSLGDVQPYRVSLSPRLAQLIESMGTDRP